MLGDNGLPTYREYDRRKMLSIEILICTIGNGIEKVPQVLMDRTIEGVTYLVAWQTDGKIPTPSILLEREDVRVMKHNTTGLSRNRNFAIKQATSDLLVISDDDTIYTPQYIINIRKAFHLFPKSDIISFQALDYSGKPLKKYFNETFLYQQRPRFTYFSSVELVVKRTEVLPTYDIRFGLGAEQLNCGEEDIFLYDSFKRGLTIRYVPLPIVNTSGRTTGGNFITSKKVQRSKGAVWGYIYSMFPAILRCLKFAVSLNNASFKERAEALSNMIWGVMYIKNTKNVNGEN